MPITLGLQSLSLDTKGSVFFVSDNFNFLNSLLGISHALWPVVTLVRENRCVC